MNQYFERGKCYGAQGHASHSYTCAVCATSRMLKLCTDLSPLLQDSMKSERMTLQDVTSTSPSLAHMNWGTPLRRRRWNFSVAMAITCTASTDGHSLGLQENCPAAAKSTLHTCPAESRSPSLKKTETLQTPSHLTTPKWVISKQP